MVSRFFVLKILTACSPGFHYPSPSGKAPISVAASPALLSFTIQTLRRSIHQVRARVFTVAQKSDNNKPAHPHYCSANPG
jgi:hypothetical protein